LHPKWAEFMVQDGDIIVAASGRRRTDTEDHELLARAWQTANDRARKLDWIV